ncbi:MAG: exodeoxyribonuclease VII large subunit [Chromatiales bacterium]|nr:exodeoxyribonuclease VII large subunit [Chromatiales bacterium]
MDEQEPGESRGSRDQIFTVSRINREVRQLLETGFRTIRVQGELSNVARPRSGHMYFTLKDSAAQVRCAMFRQSNLRLTFAPADGLAVLCRGRLSLYEARGDFQLIVEHMEEAGEGDLQRQFERLKQKLDQQGLFAQEHKRVIPALPGRIGVITSPTGAAVRDVLHVLKRRFPAVPIHIYPVPVQGEGAAARIVSAIELAATRADCDVLILTRGGGSLEDLWAFNDEALARAIYDCPIPVISGVGHEIDSTIADFVADLRAPTPSGAAELAVPDAEDWTRRFAAAQDRLLGAAARRLNEVRRRHEWLGQRLWRLHPGNRLRQRAQRLDELEQRLGLACKSLLRHRRARLQTLVKSLQAVSPVPGLKSARIRLEGCEGRLVTGFRHRLDLARRRVEAVTRTLAAVGPEATLARGYAIVTTLPDGGIVRDQAQVSPGSDVSVQVARGQFSATVKEKDPSADG